MNMNFDVPYEDMVRGARSGSSSGRRLSNGGVPLRPQLLVFLCLLLWQQARVSLRSGQFTPPPPTVVGPSAFAPSVFLAGALTVPEAEDVVNLQEREAVSMMALCGRCG
ncbi:hypothetical protein Taro_033042 [Colocasia esculenta]|uniref:Uncharacterized protein n=1 Tax=Colocasia esculenta TaxID=4460 RepID=A0A843WBA4_COLES|nr:hypothetical protein [Colocasia esculenta]